MRIFLKFDRVGVRTSDSENWLAGLFDSLNELEEVPDQCDSHVLMARYWFNKKTMGCTGKFCHNLNRAIICAVELLCSWAEQIP